MLQQVISAHTHIIRKVRDIKQKQCNCNPLTYEKSEKPKVNVYQEFVPLGRICTNCTMGLF